MSSMTGNHTAFDAFDRISQKVDQLEAQADAAKELDDFSADNDLEKKFKELEKSDDSTDQMLLELKEKMKALPEKTE
jgi:phage shock protein A